MLLKLNSIICEDKIVKYKLVADSCCELIPELKNDLQAESVPLVLSVDGKEYIDDEKLNISEFVEDMKNSKNPARSSCPSPEAFAEKCRESINTFIVTISAALSGSYQSAVMGSDIVKSENPDKKIHVFNSKSASAGEILVGLKIRECLEHKMDFDAIIETVTEFIDNMKTMFILDKLDNLVKNGRMSKVTGQIATILSLRPIFGSDSEGHIKLFANARGSLKAIGKMVDMIEDFCSDTSKRTLVITHCNNNEHAALVKSMAQKKYSFKDIYIVPMRGLSSMYANDKGIIIAF